MADLGNLSFGVHLQDYTDAEADKIKKKLEHLSIKLNIDASSSTVSNTDSIKKLIENAVKSISISSVKVDASAVKSGIEAAAQNVTPKVTVTLMKGNLSNDIQAYLDTKQFHIQVTVHATQAQQAITKALATVSVPVNVKVSSSAVMQQLRQQLAKSSVPISVRAKDVGSFVKDLKAKLGNKSIKIDLDVNKSTFNKHVKAALQGKVFKADLKLNIREASVQDAIKQAFAKAGMNYNTTASDVRAARIAEIQQRMAMRAANANRNLSGSYRQAANDANEFARASLNLSNGFRTNIRLGGQLGTVFGNIASLFSLQDVFRQVVNIGGQLENQRIALSAILQDGGKATTLFNKIQSLAVKSPFGIMDLNQYTKQLSAYGIAYNEIYDTMKRLADISAGVGVDMGRIILAFGQVKAAGFLKGTELRQFTEANIPMVEALADRFTKLRGEIVSAADVYDMISKKQISFEDVKSVLWDLTGEGGMFHNMQEVLSESLASKWKNLADAVDVMLGKIADGAIGSGLKSMAELLTSITKQWEYIAAAIGTAAISFAAYKTAVVLGSKQIAAAQGTYGFLLANKQKEAAVLQQEALYRKLTKPELALISTSNKLTNADVKAAVASGTLNKQQALRLITLRKLDKSMLRGVQRTLQISNAEIQAAQNAAYWKRALVSLGNGLRDFGLALKSIFLNPMTWIFGAITAAVEVLTYFGKKADESKQRIEDTLQVANEGYKSLKETIKEFDESVPDSDFGMATRIEEIKKVLKDNLPNWGEIFDEIYKTDNQGNYVNDLKTRYELFTQTLNNVREAYKLLANEMKGVAEAANESTDGNLDDSLIKNLKDHTEAIGEYDKAVRKLANNYAIFEDAVKAAMEADTGYKEKYEDASPYEQIKGLKDFKDAYDAFRAYAGSHNLEYSSWIKNFEEELEDLRKSLNRANVDLDTFILNYKQGLIAKGFDFNNLTEARRMAIILDLTSWFNQIDGLDEETKKLFVTDKLEKEFKIKLTADEQEEHLEKLTKKQPEYDASKDEVAKRWKKRAEEIDKAVDAYNKWKAVEGSLRAEQRIKGMDEFANLFNGKYGFTLSLEEPTDAYKYIQSKLNDKLSAQHDLRVSIGVKIDDAELDDAKDKLKRLVDNLKSELKQTTSQWDLYKQLFEATGDKEFAKSAFTNTQIWDEAALAMKEKFEAAMKEADLDFDADFDLDEASAKFIFGDLYDSWKDIKDRIEKNGIDVKVNAAKAIGEVQSIQDKITAAENKRDEELKNYTKGTRDYDAVAERWNKEIQDLQKSLWELSPEFKKLFVDTTGMSINQIEKLKEEAQKILDIIQSGTENKKTGKVDFKLNGQEYSIDSEKIKDLIEWINKLGKKTSSVKTSFQRLWAWISGDEYGTGEDKTKLKFKDIAQDLATISQEAASTAQSLSSMFEAFGDDNTADALALTGDLLNGVSSIGKGLASSNPFEVINGVAGIVTSIAGYHDKRLDRAIQRSEIEVKRLTNAYKALERVIERQLGSVTQKQSEEMLANLQKQRDEVNKQMELEYDKKKTDRSKIEDYKEQIAELDEQIQYFYEDLAKEQYNADVKDWASQIAESLTEAFAAGEDAAEAFDKTVSDILKNLVKDIIKLQVIEPAMSGLKDFLFGDSGVFTANSEGGTDLTPNEAVGLVKQMSGLKDTLGEAEKIWNLINDASDGMLDATEENTNSLSGNIKNITEDTANLLASYLNAMRQDLSVNRSLFEKLVNEDITRMSMLAQAQLTQLNNIAANTLRNADAADRIYDLFNRIVDKGGNKLKI